MLLFLAVLAEFLDLATYAPAREINPIVLGLGSLAPVAKVLLVVAIIAIAVALGRLPGRRVRGARRVLLGIALVAGAFGAWTNLA